MPLKRKLAIQSILILVVMMLQIMIPCLSFAQDDVLGTWNISKTEEDNVTATLYNTGLLVIEGTGETVDNGYSSYPWDELIMNIKSVEIKEGVINIPSYAFDEALNINTVDIAKTVKTIGYRAFSYCTNLKTVKIPEGVVTIDNSAFLDCTKLETIEIPNTVTNIGYSAFEYCTNLKTVKISKGVTTIGEYAFSDCTKLETIEIPNTVTSIGYNAFSDCSKLSNVKLPSEITTIQSNTFRRCSSLVNITIPENVTSIGYGAFMGCSSLKTIEIPEGVKTIEGETFKDCINLTGITIPETVTSIYYRAFEGCSGLKTIKLPEGVTSIGYNVFAGCSSLKTIEIPYGVKTIESETFKDCTNLTEITIPETVTYIYYRAFEGCRSLETIEIPENVSSLGSDLFNGCTNLSNINVSEDNQNFSSVDGIVFNKNQTRIINYPNGKKEIEYVIPEEITEISSYAFAGNSNLESIKFSEDNLIICSNAFENCKNLSKVEFSDSIKTIESNAFRGCISLKDIVIPENVESLGMYSFANCTNLENINILANIRTLNDYTFMGCEKLTSIVIPDSVTYIDYDVFNGCSSLKEITLPDGITGLGYGAFQDCTSLESITLPDGITRIGGRAFQNCISLEKIDLPENITYLGENLFKGCTGLTTINISANVSSIYSSAFIGCSNLESINVSGDNANYASEEGVLFNKAKTTILRYPQGKDGTEYKIPSTVTEIDDGAFEGCSSLTTVDIPEIVTYIGYNAFEGCSSLTSIIIPNEVTRIYNATFKGCSSLKTIEIPQNIQYIYESAFEGCIGLETIEIPEGVEGIGESAFKNCKSLRTITIPTTVTEIPMGPGYDIFEGCSSLQSINVTEGNPALNSNNGVLFYYNSMILIKYPEGKTDTEYTIPEGCMVVYPLGFRNANYIETINIPASLTRVDEEMNMMVEMTMFLDCNNLKNIVVNEENTTYCSEDGILYTKDKKTLVKYPEGKTDEEYVIPDNLENIGYVAFYGANNLKNITVSENNNKYSSENGILFNKDKTMLIKYLAGKEDNNYVIPESVKNIDNAAFCDCKNLTSIDLSKNLEYIGYYALTSPVPRTIYYNSDIIDALEEYTAPAEDDEEYLKNLTFELIELKSIVISKKADKLIYLEGENFDTTGMILEGIYSNGSKIEIMDYQVLDGENLSSDKDSVTISYIQGGKTLTAIQEIQMMAELLSINIVKKPKTKYVVGEDFDKTGMQVVATYSDGSIKRIENFSIEDGENLSLDKENVTISYTEGEITKTVQQKISVVNANQDDGSGDNGNTDDGNGDNGNNGNQEEPVLKGDVDGNGKIEFKDILLANRHRLGKTVLTGERLEAADINGDGKIEFSDILKINRYRLGKK